MADLGRRALLRMAGPAIALPMVANVTPAQAKEQRLVTREEIMQAFEFLDGMELRAEDLNQRYQIMIDMLFETNPAALRARLQQLIDLRKDRMVFDAGEKPSLRPLHVRRVGQLQRGAGTDSAGRRRRRQTAGRSVPQAKTETPYPHRRLADGMAFCLMR